MGGKVISVSVAIGDRVNEDDEVGILEAMKMEMPITSPSAGTIKEIRIGEGDSVEADQVLIVLG